MVLSQVGNVYVKFADEEDAETAVQALNGRYYAGRVLKAEYSPVTDFREARCRQYDEGTCGRGHYCNFMHVKEPAKELRKHLEKVFESKHGIRPYANEVDNHTNIEQLLRAPRNTDLLEAE